MTNQENLIPILAATAFCILCGTLNGTASSAFSREGKQFWISKVVPVPFYQQVLGKFLHAYAVACLGIGLGAVAVIILFQLKLSHMLIVIPTALIGTVACIAVGMIIDISRPLLNWISPQRAIKQNMNVFLGMIINLLLIVGIGFAVGWLLKKGVSSEMILFAVILTLILLALFSIYYLLKSAANKYTKIEA